MIYSMLPDTYSYIFSVIWAVLQAAKPTDFV